MTSRSPLFFVLVTASVVVTSLAAIGATWFWLERHDRAIRGELTRLEQAQIAELTRRAEAESDPGKLAAYFLGLEFYRSTVVPYLSKASELISIGRREELVTSYEERLFKATDSLLTESKQKNDGAIIAEIQRLRGYSAAAETTKGNPVIADPMARHFKILELSEGLSEAHVAAALIREHFIEMAKESSKADQAKVAELIQSGNAVYQRLKKDIARQTRSGELHRLITSPAFYDRYAKPFVTEALRIQNRKLRQKLIDTFYTRLHETAYHFYRRRLSALTVATSTRPPIPVLSPPAAVKD